MNASRSNGVDTSRSRPRDSPAQPSLTIRAIYYSTEHQSMSYGPSRGRRGGSGRHDPYGRNDRGGSRGGDYEEEVIEISTNRLYVHNLSWRVSWQDLKDHFRQAGDVVQHGANTNDNLRRAQEIEVKMETGLADRSGGFELAKVRHGQYN